MDNNLAFGQSIDLNALEQLEDAQFQQADNDPPAKGLAPRLPAKGLAQSLRARRLQFHSIQVALDLFVLISSFAIWQRLYVTTEASYRLRMPAVLVMVLALIFAVNCPPSAPVAQI